MVVLISLLIFGAWFFVSPYITLKSFGSALERGDANEVSRYADYQALREDLKIKTLLAKEVAKEVDTEEVGFRLSPWKPVDRHFCGNGSLTRGSCIHN